MTDKHLHIVTHDVPWPADHGGMTDLFYKIKALHQQGIMIHLHCFTKGRKPQDELNKYCFSVHYYPRITSFHGLSFRIPYIVYSRRSKELITCLQKDRYPVLLEGIHTTYYLYTGQLKDRKVFIRLHNVEFVYYKQLARTEKNIFKKCYFYVESMLLKRYENTIAQKGVFLAVNMEDAKLYREILNARQVQYLPVFLPYTLSVGKEGKGCYCLYHGNLSVPENEQAATWLLSKVFHELEIPFVVAGMDPSEKLRQLAHVHKHTCIVANPGQQDMQDLIAKAQLHILPSFNITGVKLKLMNALFNGRHCLVNTAAIQGSTLITYCHVAEGADAFSAKIRELYQLDYTEQEREQRQGLLMHEFNNEENARKLIGILNSE